MNECFPSPSQTGSTLSHSIRTLNSPIKEGEGAGFPVTTCSFDENRDLTCVGYQYANSTSKSDFNFDWALVEIGHQDNDSFEEETCPKHASKLLDLSYGEESEVMGTTGSAGPVMGTMSGSFTYFVTEQRPRI